MSDERPLYSVGSLGKSRWFWVVIPPYREMFAMNADGWPVIDSGYAETKEAAEVAAIARMPDAKRVQGGIAQQAHREMVARRRAEKQSDATGGQALEFVYERYQSYSEWTMRTEVSWTPHRIVKKTAKRVYVETEPYREDRQMSGKWWDYDVKTFVLDRAELERNGRAVAKALGWWRGDFYLEPMDTPEIATTPPFLVALDLEYPCTVTDVKRAYHRRSLEVHPDAGGDAEAFIELQRMYKLALAFVEERTLQWQEA